MDNVARKQVMSDFDKYKRAAEGDVAYNMMRMWQGAVGRAPTDGLVSPAYVVARPHPDTDSRYYSYLFRTGAYMEEVNKFSRGIVSDRNRLYWEEFKQMPSAFPPLGEQREIANFLDEHGKRINRLIQTKQRLIELLNEQKQAIIHNVVTHGLDPDAPMKPTGLEWMPEVPEHWEVKRLKYLVKNINDQTASRSDDEVYVALEHIESWTGEVNLPDEVPNFDSQVKRFRAGDVLFGKLRPYLAKVTRPQYKGVCVGELLVLRGHNRSLLPEYVEQKLRSRQIIDLVNSSTFGAKMPRADWAFISNISLAYPPSSEEQRTILDHIAEESKTIDTTIRRARSEIDLIGEYRTRLISDVVTGKLDVRGVELPEVEEIEDAPGVEETLLSGFADFAEESHIVP
jgi:type I restriction enzyme, S subunit